MRIPVIKLLPGLLVIGLALFSQLCTLFEFEYGHEEVSHGLSPEASTSKQEKVLHFIWGYPSADERGYADMKRVIDNSSFTGCCDRMVELAIRSYVYHLPDHKLWLWNMNGWDSEGFLHHRGLDHRVETKVFEPEVELPGDAVLQSVYSALTTMVTKSDFVRYTIMRNYGGSYVDLDGILTKPFFDDVPRINVCETVAALEGNSKVGHTSYQTCNNVTHNPRKPGTCILSNGMFINFPRNHIIFETLLRVIRDEKRTCEGIGFFCYGPKWMSATLKQFGISNIEDVGVKPTAILRQYRLFLSQETVLIEHLDFDVGDITCNEPMIDIFCRTYGVKVTIEQQERIPKTSVTCGEHIAKSCQECPGSHGPSWCNGECIWSKDQCVPSLLAFREGRWTRVPSTSLHAE